jgi:glycosyltransferase involved in cell wall biosynthesis
MLSGQIESLIALRAGLESLGHTVRLVSAFHPDWLRQDRRWATDFGDGLAVAPKVIRIGRIFTAAAAAARDCDVLHFNLPTPAFGILADILHAVTQKPVVVGFEAHLADVPLVGRRMAAAPEFYAPRLVINNGLVARLTARRAQAYVVSSHYQQAELTALGYRAEQVHVIPNLIDEAKLKRSPQVDARRELGLPAGPLVAFVGHFHDVKGHDVLIEAFRRVLIEVPQAHLALAWSGIGNRGRVRRAIARAGISDAVIELVG